MGKINWGRVVAGGIAAGIVIGIFNAILIPMFAETYRAAFGTIETDASFFVAGTVLQFGLGVVAVWLYAAIRPRYGPGPVTAGIAGFAVWLITAGGLSALVIFGNLAFGDLVALHGPHVVTWIVATNAGAWIYREGAAEAGGAGTARGLT